MLPVLKHLTMGGEGAPLVVLHGLFGSSKNWRSIGQELTKLCRVYLPDQRNHGRSFHSESHELSDLIHDLKVWLDHHKVKKPILLGHSMGGLTACGFSLTYPELISGLIVVDIAPRSYQFDYAQEFRALEIDISKLKSRAEIDVKMAKFLPDIKLRQFLQMSLMRKNEKYEWAFNIKALKNVQNRIFLKNSDVKTYTNKVLFIRGGRSNFMRDEDEQIIKGYFPNSGVVTIPEGDHWLHHSQSDTFLKIVKEFLKETICSLTFDHSCRPK